MDNITPEMLRVHLEVTAMIFQDLLNEVWKKEEIPVNWKNCFIIKIPKKRQKTLCSYWRGITLRSVSSKVVTRIIIKENRIKAVVGTKRASRFQEKLLMYSYD